MSKRALTAGFLLLAACPSAPTQTTEPTTPKPTGTVVAQAHEESLDMSPVPAPKSLLVLLRASRPKETLDAIQKLGKLPASLEKELAKATKGASEYFDLNESFDLSVGLNPAMTDIDHPRFFVSFSLPLRKSYDGLLSLIEKEGDEVRKAGPGHFRIRSKQMSCEVINPGNVVPRLVCGDSASAFRELGPWMYRTLPTTPKSPSDAFVRVDFAPARDKFLPLLKSAMDGGLGDIRRELGQVGVNDAELLDAPSAAARELSLFLEELDRIEGSATVNASKPEAALRMELFFRGNQSWATKVMTGKNAPPAPAPDVFWRLPKDSDLAMFGTDTNPALFTGIRRVAKKGLATGLQFVPLDAPDKQAITSLLDAIPQFGGTYAFASGDLAPLKGGAASVKPEAFKPENAVTELKNLVRSLTGWTVISAQGDPAQMVSFLKQAADVYERGVKFAKKRADDEVKNAAGDSKKWALERRKKLDSLPKVKFVANAPGFPKGGAFVDIDVAFDSKNVWRETHPIHDFDKRPEHPKGAGVTGHIVIRFAVAPDEGGRYVWGFAADPELLKEKLLTSLKSGKPENQLGARTDIDRMKSPLHAGGFLTPGRYLRAIAKVDARDSDSRELLAVLDMLPNAGMGPMFLISGGAAGATPSLSTELILDRKWVEDAGFAIGWFFHATSSSPPSSSKQPRR